jgi:glycosidase
MAAGRKWRLKTQIYLLIFFFNIVCFWQQSVFGGPAWTWNEDRQQYYLHQFDPKQPDLNYKNPEVVAEMKVIITKRI